VRVPVGGSAGLVGGDQFHDVRSERVVRGQAHDLVDDLLGGVVGDDRGQFDHLVVGVGVEGQAG